MNTLTIRFEPQALRAAALRSSLSAHALRASAANGFGGMGSWNDQGFTDQAVQAAYVEASQRLFVLVLHAFVAGANAA